MRDEYVLVVDRDLESSVNRVFVINCVVSLCIAMCVTVASIVLTPNVNCGIGNRLPIAYNSAFDCLYLDSLVCVIPARTGHRSTVVIAS